MQASRSKGSIEANFARLAAIWLKETAFQSSIHAIAMHPAYQRIIGMGDEAVPLILKELEREPNHWFWALSAITGEDPVLPADRGDVRKMAQAWLDWANSQGLGNR